MCITETCHGYKIPRSSTFPTTPFIRSGKSACLCRRDRERATGVSLCSSTTSYEVLTEKTDVALCDVTSL
ncbi:hypothetical protein Y032_0013g1990 [Ancylostoma ceylanicum]|uniref:Uncharacterized protein n=1 Tax=Ancylostoma ceylanicum TaxID=53326 RepID=A0A016VAC6_9BILA|nr:hypothetical protein Y032_0013g1990 [Ancylostoma ceylanicum]